MKNTILTMLLLCCFGLSLSAQSEKPVETIEEEAPVFMDQEIAEEAPAPVRRAAPAPPPAEVFKVVEQMPSFPGCDEVADKNARHTCGKKAMLKYISEHPAYEDQKGSSGVAVVQFIVRADGSIDNVKTVRAHTEDMETVLSINGIFENMPKWTPGKQRGKAVDVEMTVPVKF